MRHVTLFAVMLGLLLAGLLVAYAGTEDLLDAVRHTGWAAVLVVAARLVALTGDGIAWRLLFPVTRRPRAALCVGLRVVREGVNQLLPVAQVGGDFIGARLMTFWRVEGSLAGASVIADIAVQATTQFTFAVVGLAILVALNGDGAVVRTIGVGLLVASFGLAGFALVQRREGARLLSGLLRRLAGGREWMGIGAVERLYEGLGAIYAGRRGLAASFLIHLGVWFFGSVEVWIVLNAVGFPVGPAEAIVIESLGQAVRGAAFAVPGAIGIQEGGFIALCALFGVPPGPALALSLVKRVPDFVLGIPGIIAWQSLEGRRIFGRARPAAAAAAPAYGEPI